MKERRRPRRQRRPSPTLCDRNNRTLCVSLSLGTLLVLAMVALWSVQVPTSSVGTNMEKRATSEKPRPLQPPRPVPPPKGISTVHLPFPPPQPRAYPDLEANFPVEWHADMAKRVLGDAADRKLPPVCARLSPHIHNFAHGPNNWQVQKDPVLFNTTSQCASLQGFNACCSSSADG
jgi:hypothetical protein